MPMPPDKTGSAAILISPEARLTEELTGWLKQERKSLEIGVLRSYPNRSQLAHALNGHIRFLLVDASSKPSAALETMAEAARLKPGVLVVAALSAEDPDLILKCVRQGAIEFLVAPFSAEQVRTVLSKVDRIGGGAGPGEGARTLCVIPAKGGCGASTVASHLALEWKRRGNQRILLADLDPLAGTLSFLLKLKSAHSFADVLLRSDEIDEDIWKAMVCPSQGVDMLLAPETLAEGMGDLRDPTPLIRFARGHYDGIVLDAGGAYGPWNLGLADLADEILLVTHCEISVVYAAQRVLFHLESHGIDRDKIRLVVNRAGRDLGLSPERVGEALDMDVLYAFPEDADEIHDALVDGKLVSASSAFGKAVRGLAEALAGGRKPPREQPAGVRNRVLTLFT